MSIWCNVWVSYNVYRGPRALTFNTNNIQQTGTEIIRQLRNSKKNDSKKKRNERSTNRPMGSETSKSCSGVKSRTRGEYCGHDLIHVAEVLWGQTQRDPSLRPLRQGGVHVSDVGHGRRRRGQDRCRVRVGVEGRVFRVGAMCGDPSRAE